MICSISRLSYKWQPKLQLKNNILIIKTSQLFVMIHCKPTKSWFMPIKSHSHVPANPPSWASPTDTDHSICLFAHRFDLFPIQISLPQFALFCHSASATLLLQPHNKHITRNMIIIIYRLSPPPGGKTGPRKAHEFVSSWAVSAAAFEISHRRFVGPSEERHEFKGNLVTHRRGSRGSRKSKKTEATTKWEAPVTIETASQLLMLPGSQTPLREQHYRWKSCLWHRGRK